MGFIHIISNLGQGNCATPRKTLTATSSTSTLRNIKVGYFLLSSTKIGDITRHGPHQVAVKSTTICSHTRTTGCHHSLVCKTFFDSTPKHFVKGKGLSLPAAAWKPMMANCKGGDGQANFRERKKERKKKHLQLFQHAWTLESCCPTQSWSPPHARHHDPLP